LLPTTGLLKRGEKQDGENNAAKQLRSLVYGLAFGEETLDDRLNFVQRNGTPIVAALVRWLLVRWLAVQVDRATIILPEY
jgi:hypothetical protein